MLLHGTTRFEAAPALAAGWRDDGVTILFETDLTQKRWPLAEAAIEGGEALVQRPDVQKALAQLGRPADWSLEDDFRLVVLPDEAGYAAALAAIGSVNGPNNRVYAAIDMIGVLPSQRSKGLGTRLHAHALARLATQFERHHGSTDEENVAMRRVFAKNDAVEVGRQWYFER